MTGDEKAILEYLKNWPDLFISPKEIARKVGGKQRFEEDRFWPVAILQEMTQKGWLEADYVGHYRVRPVETDKSEKKKRHVSPQILKILKGSGKNFGDLFDVEEGEKPSSPGLRPAQGKRPPPGKS
jgi:hypothetical protein